MAARNSQIHVRTAPPLKRKVLPRKGPGSLLNTGPWCTTQQCLSCASLALNMPAIQASRAPNHDYVLLGAELVADGGAGRESSAVAGEGHILVAGCGGV